MERSGPGNRTGAPGEPAGPPITIPVTAAEKEGTCYVVITVPLHSIYSAGVCDAGAGTKLGPGPGL